MEKRIKKNQKTFEPRKVIWGADEAIKDLLDHGAIEISPEEMKKEPYITYMKNIKRNGKFICD